MFTGIDWTTDVLPLITTEIGSSLIQGSIATYAMIGIVGFAVSTFIGVWKRRD